VHLHCFFRLWTGLGSSGSDLSRWRCIYISNSGDKRNENRYLENRSDFLCWMWRHGTPTETELV
jgi:hypothetical protein